MAGFYKVTERSMGMSDAVWRRHANSLSAWTRILSGLPLIALAIWSRVWIGWGALIVLAAVAVWIWLNPRVFPEPRNFDAWTSRAVLGEYVFLNRRDTVAAHHIRMANVLSWSTLPGLILLVAGLWRLDLVWTFAGTVLTILPKLWFLDRMVWLYQEFLQGGASVLGITHEGDGL
ncbi:DUF6653 family protein [Marivita hallyeonensis]|uniref:Uncharacterized protein n=1 Tax=Marivita hallyeonensis TaxID=996342 RepID=A0A1M5RK70_9RHOB|nr:DUF6653 family protein [Marivita hallyeonensis]SHH26488.1 hypothetical protein SAMN05443551_1787 [Marivita hallyeonensis]